jgi:alkaline phosphatase
MFNRRKFLTFSSALAASGAVGFPRVAYPAEKLHQRRGQRPRHIIHLVADGMSHGTWTCADLLSKLERGRGLSWADVCQRPETRAALMDMRSLDSLVTDSAAASSSWGSGARVLNGKVNQTKAGDDLTTLYDLFGAAGWKRALVTTTEITHATPAGFAANVANRDQANRIAAQYLERKVDVLLGGGRKFFDPKQRSDKRDLLAEYHQAGYVTMRTRDELLAAPTDRRWLGVFENSHMPYWLDHRNDPKRRASVPSLAEMTSAALGWLENKSNFILQIEGGRVDHACHNNDAAAALYDMLAFDEALDLCLSFQKRVPDTLLVITTDHGNANPGLNGSGGSITSKRMPFSNLLEIKRSFPGMLDLMRSSRKYKGENLGIKQQEAKRLNSEAHPDLELAELDSLVTGSDAGEKEVFFVKPINEIIDVIHQSTGYKISERRARQFAPFLAKKGTTLYDHMNSDVAALGQLMGNYLGIGFSGVAHTADYVKLSATGPGADQFTGLLKNTEIFYKYLGFARIDFRNPTEPERTVEVTTQAAQVEHVEDYALHV